MAKAERLRPSAAALRVLRSTRKLVNDDRRESQVFVNAVEACELRGEIVGLIVAYENKSTRTAWRARIRLLDFARLRVTDTPIGARAARCASVTVCSQIGRVLRYIGDLGKPMSAKGDARSGQCLEMNPSSICPGHFFGLYLGFAKHAVRR
ncbi:MAG: hypothetical protein ACKVS9_19390 [Phycisphaerae bacterium]